MVIDNNRLLEWVDQTAQPPETAAKPLVITAKPFEVICDLNIGIRYNRATWKNATDIKNIQHIIGIPKEQQDGKW